MAEPAAANILELAPLSRLGSAALDPLLDEEVHLWRRQLRWDYRPSADLVRHYVGVQSLSGFALMTGGEAVGYSYFVVDDNKGLIGDLYVRDRWRTAENEHRLLAEVVGALVCRPSIRRIESQLMLFSSARAPRCLTPGRPALIRETSCWRNWPASGVWQPLRPPGGFSSNPGPSAITKNRPA